MKTRNNKLCRDCRKPFQREPGSIGTGYGYDAKGWKVCYACCGKRDLADMIETGTATLYLTGGKGSTYPLNHGAHSPLDIINWPGTLRIRAHYSTLAKGGGGFGSNRIDVWFTGPDGKAWHGINRGDMDILRCRRLKAA